MNTNALFGTESTDAQLVAQSLAGSRDAFALIVRRYQVLICGLIFSATGSIHQSEDLAQETFITAWKQLSQLREPSKLRSWLCTIARNLAYHARQKFGHEPVHGAQTLENLDDVAAAEPQPLEHVISNEEQALLWHAIEHIPQIYREPLVLFYREHQSIERVAQNLELTEDAVRQRLSRGRKLLRAELAAFVEGALESTGPNSTFAAGVVAALPLISISTETATLTLSKILLMTKTTKAVLVTAVVTAAVVTPATVLLLRDTPPAPPQSVGRALARSQVLTAQQAAEAKATAESFFKALGKGDWDEVARLYPQNAPKGRTFDDVFNDKLKNYLQGVQVISLGEPYKEGRYPGVFVPYEIRFRDGSPKKFRLTVRNDNPEGRWFWDGGL